MWSATLPCAAVSDWCQPRSSSLSRYLVQVGWSWQTTAGDELVLVLVLVLAVLVVGETL